MNIHAVFSESATENGWTATARRSFIPGMRRLTVALLVLFIAFSAQGAEQDTAYEALRLVGQQLNRAYLNRVISVNGVEGDPQPAKWNILLADRAAPGGVREVQVANGRIIANRTPSGGVVGSTENATITAARLNLDSSGAFSVASYTADKSHVNFDRVSYTLRTNDRGNPVWIVTLQDQLRQPLGTIQINAVRGNVTRVEGMYRGANMAHVEEERPDRGERLAREDHGDRVARESVDRSASEDEYVEGGDDAGIEENDEDENIVKRRIKEMFHRTRDDAARMFHRVRRSFADFIAGDRD